MSRSRTLVVRVLLALGALLAGLGLVAGHVNRNVIDGPTFADHVDALRRDDAVATQVGQAITTQLVLARPDLVALRPLVEAVAIRVAGSDVLSGPVRLSARTANTALTQENADSVALRIVDAGAVVTGVIGVVAPDRAPTVTNESVTLASIGGQSFAGTTLAITRAVGLLAWLLPLVALACLVGAVLASTDRWRTAVAAGRALLLMSGLLGVMLIVGGFLVRRLDDDTLGGAVGRAAWQQFVRPMWWEVGALALVGAAMMMVAGSALPGSLRAQLESSRLRLLRRPASTLGIVARAVVVGFVGMAAIMDPAGLVEAGVVIAGILLVLFALSEIAQIADTARAVRAVDTSGDITAEGSRSRQFPIVAGVVTAAIAVLGVIFLARPGREVDVVAATNEGCNGHVELCDRPFNDVAFVASHNSMSVAREPGWFLAEQLDPIPQQLDQGVRALLIDVWSGRPAGTVVRTAASSYEEAIAITREELGPDVAAAAARIANAVAGEAEGPEARFLCHGACETGSTPFVPMLAETRDWLAANPNEVVTLFIEDHVDASLIAADVQAAGLVPYVYQPVVGEPWPTLGDMIESGQRLVVMVEEGSGEEAAPWLVNGFEFTQDTPYTFPTVESFSCAPNRGPDDAPLFLLNHWLANFSSLVTDSQRVNVSDVLLTRAEQCRDERGQIPNFVAVNFVAIGDVYEVVDALNGVS